MKGKREIAAVLAVLLAGCSAQALAAESVSEYASYKQAIGESRATASIELQAAAVSDAENAGLAGQDALEWNGQGRVSWDFSVTEEAAYTVTVVYRPQGAGTDPVELSLLLDGELPFSEAETLFLPRYWENDGAIRTDGEGNEFAPKAKPIEDFRAAELADASGFTTAPFGFWLTAGAHRLTLVGKAHPVAIQKIVWKPVAALSDYRAYAAAQKGKAYSGEVIAVEGEDAAARSKNSMVPLSDNAGAAIVPQSAFTAKINYIGGKNWNRPGDTIEWKIRAPRDGFYTLGFSYRQNQAMNEVFYRTLKIDGEIPFAEAAELAFPYTGGWSNTLFADASGEPYRLWLTKGEHTLSLSVTMGGMAEICRQLNALVYDLAAFYRGMVMITGENPDANRDYSLFTQMEDFDGRLRAYAEKLEQLLGNLREITGTSSGSAAANLRNMKDVVERMRSNKYYAHQYKQRFYDNYAALSAWVYERSSMPLDLDAFFLSAPAQSKVQRKAGFFGKAGFSVKRFLASFVSQYREADQEEGKNSITLWINWGRDQAKVLKNLVGSDFTEKTGIRVNIRITNATLLQGILSGNGPDCSIQVPRSEPVNLAMRGGLCELSSFPGYSEVMERFMPGAGTPYAYRDGQYGIPTTQSFYMMFVRTDIFEQMGLSVPQTWEEFLNVSNLLFRKNMQVGLPYTQITDMAQVNNGVGALNIFPTLLLQKGLSLYNEQKTASTLSEPATAETFVQWTDYYNQYGFPRAYDFYNRFRVGLMPMAVVPYTMYATLTAAAPEIGRFWKMMPVPGTRVQTGELNRAVSGSGTAAIILKASKKADLAWEFIKWWTSADIQYAYASEVENILGTAARYDTANVEALQRLSWDRENLSALLTQWENVREIPEIPGGYYLSRVIDQAFWNTTNGEDPYEMVEKWGRVANQEIERKNRQYGNREE